MKKHVLVFSILLSLCTLLAACTGKETQTEPPSPPVPTETSVEPSPTETQPTIEPTTQDSEQPEIAYTQIKIDGKPGDWEHYEILFSDPEGDHQGGGFDVSNVKAILNDTFLYVLVDTHSERHDYAQVDLELSTGDRQFVISFRPEEGGFANMGEVTSGEWVSLGEVNGSDSADGEVIEFKMPLSALDYTDELTLLMVRPMAGTGGEDWYAVDETSSAEVLQVNELEPFEPEMLSPPVQPRVCAFELESPIPFGAFESAALQFSQPGYAAEWFVAPAKFNMPQDILLTPQGDIFVLATRNFALYRVTQEGNVTTLAENVHGYTSDVDAEGNLYLYSQPDGWITRVTPNGNKSFVAQAQSLITDCTSGMGIGPDGNLYAARSLCDQGLMDKADLYRITLGGEVTRVAEEIPALFALKTDANGRFVAAAMGEELYEVSLSDFSMNRIGKIPGHEGIAVNGLAADIAGNFYISTGTWSQSGQVYRFDVNGDFTLIADIPGNGLSGIEWLPDTGELLGVQLQLGTLISIAVDGTLKEIVPGNGLITPRGIAFSPCGELAVSNEDGGMMALIDPAGSVNSFFEYNSFTSPVSFVVFNREGRLYVTEGAPGFPERIMTVAPGESSPSPLVDVARPGGIVQRPDGMLFVAETIADRIAQVDSNGTVAVFADGLTRPTALVLDADGTLYAVIGTGGHPLDEIHMPDAGDTIIYFSPDGSVTELTKWSKLAGLAFAPDGDIYAATGWDGGIVRVSSDGTITPFVSGLQEVTDIAFDLAGNLYASDTVQNGILRISGFAQGTLSGMVTDASGSPIEEARVQVLSTRPIVVGQVVFTDSEGHFSLPAAPRSYELIVMKEGFETATLESIDIYADQETMIEITLGG
jgi:sugar lactone lactonase YvrE